MYDPYSGGYADPYGYDPYGFQQGVEDNPPPPPDKDWVDVPKVNRKYIKKIKNNIIQKDFKHLKEERLYSIEVLLDHVELYNDINEGNEPKDIKDDTFALKLKILHFPEKEVPLTKRTTTTVTGGATQSMRSVLSGILKSPPMVELFQTMLTSVTDMIKKKAEGDLEVPMEESEEEDTGEEGYFENAPIDTAVKAPIVEEPAAKVDEDVSKNVTRLEVMKGKNVLMVSTGLSLIQELQKPGLMVTLEHVEMIGEEEEEEQSENRTVIGTGFVNLPRQFPRAVLNSTATEAECRGELVDKEGSVVGEVYAHVSLACLGLAVVTDMAEAVTPFYDRTRVMFDFSPDDCFDHVGSQWDPVVHPRLAVTLMNLEPPGELCRTSTQIIRDCLDNRLLPQPEDQMRLTAFLSRHCWWLETARNLEACQSSVPGRTGLTPQRSESGASINADLYTMWRDHKIVCRHFHKNQSDEEPNPLQSLYNELDELLSLDKIREPSLITQSETSNNSKRMSDISSRKTVDNEEAE